MPIQDRDWFQEQEKPPQQSRSFEADRRTRPARHTSKGGGVGAILVITLCIALPILVGLIAILQSRPSGP